MVRLQLVLIERWCSVVSVVVVDDAFDFVAVAEVGSRFVTVVIG